MAVKNLSNASGVLFDERRKFYLSPQDTAELQPNVTPFLSMLQAKGGRTTGDPDFKLFEHRNAWRRQRFQVNEGSPDAWPSGGDPGEEVTVTTDSFEGVSLNDALVGKECEVWDSANSTYRGVVRVESVNTGTNEVTFQSIGDGTTSNFQISNFSNNDNIYVIGSAYGESTTAPEADSDELDIIYNSTQIFKTAVEVTGTLEQAALRGYSNELARLRREKAKEHKIQIERSLLFGARRGIGHSGPNSDSNDSFATTITDANGNTVRTTMGLVTAIRRYGVSADQYNQAVFTIDGSYEWNNFVDDMEEVFYYDDSHGVKVAFCGPQALSYWSKMSGNANSFANNSSWTVNLGDVQTDQRLGINFRDLETPHGVLRLIRAPVLSQTPYRGYMVVVDESNADIVRYRPTRYETDIKTDDGYDGTKDQWLSDLGMGIQLVESHKLFKVTV